MVPVGGYILSSRVRDIIERILLMTVSSTLPILEYHGLNESSPIEVAA